ncbi:MAG: ferredoxin [Bacteroidia bacterium]|nr:ferredoxin [Bacteroidia bacterium]
MIKIFHYKKKCIGCNACVELNSKRWRISQKDGKSVLIGGIEKKGELFYLETDEDDFELAQQIADSCPARIIKVEQK